jgi:hypothetical protein
VGSVNTVGDGAHPDLPSHGFAISDLLLATKADPKIPAPHRWTDLNIVPVTGTLAHGSEFTLVWENYEFGDAQGQTKYGIAVTLAAERAIPDRITAKIVGSLNGMIGRSDYVDGVLFRFERVTAYAPTVVDELSVSLDKTPPGGYLVTLEITDHVTGKVATRTQRIFIK